jgi:hypothetical protein
LRLGAMRRIGILTNLAEIDPLTRANIKELAEWPRLRR